MYNYYILFNADVSIARDMCICMYGDNPVLGFYTNKLFDLI